eukprot:TRINITY_DN7419_c0_g1_i1.p1 TRINITY_DN7419_c0_g1~~TRINITY_DN7419_c0_g1_i1.p1  ORF type:complete len:723 (+),score=249.28 TRINITY_DN7419_c0_g1_i1:91-2259(+)
MGGKKAAKAPPEPAARAAVPITQSKTEREFWGGDGVKFTAAKTKGRAGELHARVSVASFRSLGAAPAQPVIVEAGEKGVRVLQLLPSNALVAGQILLPDGMDVTGPVMVKAVPPGAGAAPVASATATLNGDDPDGGATVPDHILGSLLRAQLCGRAVTPPMDGCECAVIPCTVTVMRRSLAVDVRPHVPCDAGGNGIMWFDASTDFRLVAADGAAGGKGGAATPPPCIPAAVWSRIEAARDGRGVCGVVVHGPRGVGKSFAARQIGGALGWDTTVLSDAFLAEASLKAVAAVFETTAPLVVVLDENQTLLQGSDDAASPGLYLEETLCKQFERPVRAAPLVVVACVASVDALPKRLTTHGRLDQEVHLEPPANAEERHALLRSILRLNGWAADRLDACGDDLRTIAAKAHGFVAVDFQILYSTAELAAAGAPVAAAHLVAAAKVVRPASLKSLEVSIPSVRWEDIGGQAEAKQVLRECVEWPLKYADLFATLALKAPAGVLLYGPPGCSKTLLAKALATECSYNFIAIKGPELYNKWVGESEKAVRDVFSKARAAAPAVVFFDEIDGMCGKRGGGGVTDRVISQFLTEMDGLPNQKADGRQVIVLAATNRPDNIDPALLRPGRIDRKVYIQLPDAATRAEICRITLGKIPTAANVNYERLGEALDGRSGAEVVSAMKEGVQHCLKRNEHAACVDQRDLMRGVQRVLPRTNKDHLKFYENWGK